MVFCLYVIIKICLKVHFFITITLISIKYVIKYASTHDH